VPLQCFLITACFFAAFEYLAVNSEENSNNNGIRQLIFLPALFGLAMLTSYGLIAMTLPLALLLAGSGHRPKLAIVTLIAGSLLIVAPWIARNIMLGTGPFGLAHWSLLRGSAVYPAYELDRTLDPAINSLVAIKMVKLKVFANMAEICSGGFAAIGAGIVSCLFVTSLLFPIRESHVDRLRWSVVAAAVIQIVVVAAKGRDYFSELHLLLPLIVLFGMAFAIGLIWQHEDIREGWHPVLVGLIVFISALPTVARLAGMPAQIPYPPYYPPMITHVAQMLEEDEILCTDIPWATAWYGRRISALLPRNPDDLDDLGTISTRIGAIYLTTETGNKPYTASLVSGFDANWLPVLEGHVPESWVFTNAIALPYGTRDQILVSDRALWK